MEQVQAALQALIAQGKKDGMIRLSDLNAQLEKLQLSPEKIEEIYSDFEQLPQIKEYIRQAGQDNLAKVFTEVRYPERDSVAFSKSYMEFAKKQDMM